MFRAVHGSTVISPSDANQTVKLVARLADAEGVRYLRTLRPATPVIYPVALLSGSARVLIAWQPLFALFASYQTIFSGGRPSAGLILQTALWAFGLLFVGGQLFLRHEREFALHL